MPNLEALLPRSCDLHLPGHLVSQEKRLLLAERSQAPTAASH